MIRIKTKLQKQGPPGAPGNPGNDGGRGGGGTEAKPADALGNGGGGGAAGGAGGGGGGATGTTALGGVWCKSTAVGPSISGEDGTSILESATGMHLKVNTMPLIEIIHRKFSLSRDFI